MDGLAHLGLIEKRGVMRDMVRAMERGTKEPPQHPAQLNLLYELHAGVGKGSPCLHTQSNPLD